MSEQTVNVAIDGMTCGSCVYKIECELSDLEGVTEAKVDLQAKRGTVKMTGLTPDDIVKKINELGFKAKLV
jgi:copper chaperone CopZ